VFLDATYLHVRRIGQVTSMAGVVATGVTANGGRKVLGCDVGDSEDEVFWGGFLRTLKQRGLAGVQRGACQRRPMSADSPCAQGNSFKRYV
jgi:putative transposase